MTTAAAWLKHMVENRFMSADRFIAFCCHSLLSHIILIVFVYILLSYIFKIKGLVGFCCRDMSSDPKTQIPPAPQWFSSIEDPAWEPPGPMAGTAQTQVMSPNINILETNTSVLTHAGDNSVAPTELVQGVARPFHPDEDGVLLAEGLQRRQTITSNPSSSTSQTLNMSMPSPRTSAAARAAASLHSEKSRPPVVSVVDLPGTPRRKRAQDALPELLPLPDANRRAGSLPPTLPIAVQLQNVDNSGTAIVSTGSALARSHVWQHTPPPVSDWETLRNYLRSYCDQQDYLRDLTISENATMYAERMQGWKEACKK